MWIPTEDDAVEMFARHFEALHRSGAAVKAEERAFELQAAGDGNGERIWKRVAVRINEIRHDARISQRRHTEAA